MTVQVVIDGLRQVYSKFMHPDVLEEIIKLILENETKKPEILVQDRATFVEMKSHCEAMVDLIDRLLNSEVG